MHPRFGRCYGITSTRPILHCRSASVYSKEPSERRGSLAHLAMLRFGWGALPILGSKRARYWQPLTSQIGPKRRREAWRPCAMLAEGRMKKRHEFWGREVASVRRVSREILCVCWLATAAGGAGRMGV
jgi:hypothetical protein